MEIDLKRAYEFMFYGDTCKENYDAIKPKIEEYNKNITLAFASVATFLISMMIVLSNFVEGFAGSKLVYFFGVIFSILLLIVSRLANKFPWLSYVGVYMAVSVFFAYGIAIATITRPQNQTVTFMVLLIFVPLIFIDRPFRMAVTIILYIMIFVVLALKTKTGSVLTVDLTDVAIFGLLSIIAEFIVYTVKIKALVLEHQLHILSETDQLTKLNNRNSYELKLNSYPGMYNDSICCIYIDANGLHELNNRNGHNAGDEMLCNVADMIVKYFGRNDSYRVGGDEYVVFVMDVTAEEIEKKLNGLKEDIKKEGYSISIGSERWEEKNVNMTSLIVNAETKMYEEKEKYYQDHKR